MPRTSVRSRGAARDILMQNGADERSAEAVGRRALDGRHGRRTRTPTAAPRLRRRRVGRRAAGRARRARSARAARRRHRRRGPGRRAAGLRRPCRVGRRSSTIPEPRPCVARGASRSVSDVITGAVALVVGVVAGFAAGWQSRPSAPGGYDGVDGLIRARSSSVPACTPTCSPRCPSPSRPTPRASSIAPQTPADTPDLETPLAEVTSLVGAGRDPTPGNEPRRRRRLRRA